MYHRLTSHRIVAIVAVFLMLAAGCGDDEATDSTVSASESSPNSSVRLDGTVRVAAAQSLKGAFEEIGAGFESANTGVTVEPDFDASSALVTRILEGADADVFASADEANMTKLTDEDLISGDPEVFARNELVIITKPGNPEGITGLADLADVGVVSLCGEEVPCGKYAQEALDAAAVSIPESAVTRGQNAGATLTAVSEGDAVAGVVYVTDAEAAGDAVDAVAIPADQNVIATYPIGALTDSGNKPLAEAFVAFVLGDEGQRVLKEFGFLPPA